MAARAGGGRQLRVQVHEGGPRQVGGGVVAAAFGEIRQPPADVEEPEVRGAEALEQRFGGDEAHGPESIGPRPPAPPRGVLLSSPAAPRRRPWCEGGNAPGTAAPA